MNLPAPVGGLVEEALGAPARAASPVGGGCINHAARVETAQGVAFVKWRRGAPADFFPAEAAGLERLASTGTVRVPEVLAVSTAGIVMTWIEPARDRERAMVDGGRRLAMLHEERGLTPGLDENGYLGSLPQDNTPPSDGRWLTFFRERRLGLLAHVLSADSRRRLERLPLESLLEEPDRGSALLHGDLWGGNMVCGPGGRGWLVDPAVYAGHPEVDLAMTRLFGGFDSGFYDAYQEVAGTFDPGLDDRLDLLNLYPLLVHVHLFGGGYAAQVDGILRRYVAP